MKLEELTRKANVGKVLYIGTGVYMLYRIYKMIKEQDIELDKYKGEVLFI